MASNALAIEPLMLGQGRADSVINLDAGSRQGAMSYYFGGGGFVSPKTPQPMVLSPGILVYQSQKLKQECQEILRETVELLNQTRLLAEEVRELEASAREYARRSAVSANESAIFAAQAGRSLKETQSIYNETRISARKMETLVKRETYARRPFEPQNDALGDGRPDDLQSLQSRITALERKIELLEKKTALLENSAAVH